MYFSILMLVGCIPPNKIPQTTIVAFGAIIDIWNVSIMDKKYYSTSPLKINHRKMGDELLFSEIIGRVLDYFCKKISW